MVRKRSISKQFFPRTDFQYKYSSSSLTFLCACLPVVYRDRGGPVYKEIPHTTVQSLRKNFYIVSYLPALLHLHSDTCTVLLTELESQRQAEFVQLLSKEWIYIKSSRPFSFLMMPLNFVQIHGANKIARVYSIKIRNWINKNWRIHKFCRIITIVLKLGHTVLNYSGNFYVNRYISIHRRNSLYS